MKDKELKEVLEILEKAGWQPQLCDTPIPVYESVHAGNPIDPGQIPADMTLVPKALFSLSSEMMVRVSGNSMIDAGIEDGDIVKMAVLASPHEGDIVVVAIGMECTVKSYYVDDDGTPWLVPQNHQEKDRYRVIRLDEETEGVYLCGVVKEVFKPLPRVPGRAMRSIVEETKARYDDEPKISEQRVRRVIKIIGAEIKVGRLWYAVCRSFIDELLIPEKGYDIFCGMVKNVLPYHQHLPKEAEMQVMAVASFTKRVGRWDELNAPVKGKRFRNYKSIAEKTTRLLTMSETEFRSYLDKL